MLKLKTRNDEINKEIFTNAVVDAYDSLTASGFTPILYITSEVSGRFSVSWYDWNDSLNTLSYWTDQNIGLYSSCNNGKVIFAERLRANDFFNLCYKNDEG